MSADDGHIVEIEDCHRVHVKTTDRAALQAYRAAVTDGKWWGPRGGYSSPWADLRYFYTAHIGAVRAYLKATDLDVREFSTATIVGDEGEILAQAPKSPHDELVEAVRDYLRGAAFGTGDEVRVLTNNLHDALEKNT
jgi:hypothetical protein